MTAEGISVLEPENIRELSKRLAGADRSRIRELVAFRRAAGLTQADVAERLGVSTRWVRRFEQYDSDPRLSKIRRYIVAISIPADVDAEQRPLSHEQCEAHQEARSRYGIGTTAVHRRVGFESGVEWILDRIAARPPRELDSEERHALVQGAVEAILPHAVNETQAYNVWNNLASDERFVRAILAFNQPHAARPAEGSTS